MSQSQIIPYTLLHIAIPSNLSKTICRTKSLKKRDILKNYMKMAETIRQNNIQKCNKKVGQSKEKAGQQEILN